MSPPEFNPAGSTGLIAPPDRAKALARAARDWPAWSLTSPQRSSLFLLLTRGLAPLKGFMGRADAESCLAAGRLQDGTWWPVPVVLDVTAAFARNLVPDTPLALQDAEGVTLAALHVTDVWPRDPQAPCGPEASATAPLSWAVGGLVEGIRLPDYSDFKQMHLGADVVRLEVARRRWQTVMAFVSGGFPTRPEFESTMRVLEQHAGHLLLLPVVEMPASDDRDYFARVRSYQTLAARYPADRVMTALLPLPSREGPALRNLLLEMVVARNYGATHFIVTDEGPGDAVLTEAEGFARELGITMVKGPSMVYRPDSDEYMVATDRLAQLAPVGRSAHRIEGLLARGEDVPGWLTFPEVARELRRRYPPRRERGFTVFFTGLSGSGKSTIASALTIKLMQRDNRRVTLLDGDLVRKHLSSELGFSREHRDLNIRRIGFVAGEITKHGGAAICAPIAPYRSIRAEVRRAIQPAGGFCLVFVDTPLEVCEQRDRKGLYAKARAGLISGFTGVSDPYEAPDDADVVIETTRTSPVEAVEMILGHLEREGYLAPGRAADEE